MKNLHQMKPRQRICGLLTGELDLSSKWWLQSGIWYEMWQEGVAPLVWQRYSEQGDAELQQTVQQTLSEGVRLHKLRFMRQNHGLAQILRVLNEAEIPVICMRGRALAEHLYQPSFLRAASDIDLLYDERQSLMLKQLLHSRLGFSPAPKYPNLFVRGDLPVDLHSEPLGIERILAWEFLTPLRAPDFFKHAEWGKLAGEKALLVHPRVNLPYLCFHALKHSFERLLWLYDIALLANQVTQDDLWDEVFAGIAEYKLERPCYYALSYVSSHMAAAVPADKLAAIKPGMGYFERRLFNRFMNHEVIPYLAERLFSRMQPSLKHRLEFWRETIYPRLEIRQQIAGSGCTKCNFTRQRLKLIFRAIWPLKKES